MGIGGCVNENKFGGQIRPSATFYSVVARRALPLHVRLNFLYINYNKAWEVCVFQLPAFNPVLTRLSIMILLILSNLLPGRVYIGCIPKFL